MQNFPLNQCSTGVNKDFEQADGLVHLDIVFLLKMLIEMLKAARKSHIHRHSICMVPSS